MSTMWETLADLFRRETLEPYSLDHERFDELCRDKPELARAALASDQRELLGEFERLVEAYEQRLSVLALKIRELPPQAAERELSEIREAQNGLRIMLRRVETSASTARQLERELYEWEQREHETGKLHADHPKIRAEIVRSEMEARGIPTRRQFFRPVAVSPCSEASAAVNEAAFDEAPLQSAMPEIAEAGAIEDAASRRVEAEQLLRTIKMLTREVERWQGHAKIDPEVLDDIHELRALHGELKRLDRAKNIRRDRLAYAVRGL